MNTNCLEGMKCPRCGNEDKLLVLASVWIALQDDGSDPSDDALKMHGDQEYDNDSTCECPECGCTAALGLFMTPPDLGQHHRPPSVTDCAAVARCLTLYWENQPHHEIVDAVLCSHIDRYRQEKLDACHGELTRFMGGLDKYYATRLMELAVNRYWDEVICSGY